MLVVNLLHLVFKSTRFKNDVIVCSKCMKQKIVLV